MQNLMPPIDTTDHAFHDGDPTTGQLGTIVTAAWLNDVQGATRDIQAEIIAVLTKAGIQPNPQKQNQLAEAISQIIGSGGYATSGDLTLGLSKKIDKADIAQQLGNDTTKVPSLHLVTTELGKKASVADANSKLAKDQNGADIPNKDTFIKNLGLPEKYQAVGYSYSKTESDNNFQPRGSYQPAGDYLNKNSTDTQVVNGEIQSKGWVGSIFDDKKLSFIAGRNGLPVWGSYDGVNFRYVNHPKKSGTAALTSDLFGIEQEWYDLKNERSVGVNYQNKTSKPICLFVRLGSSQFQTTEIKVSGKTVAMWTSSGSSGTTTQGAFTVIPPGAFYAVIANQGGSSVLDWTEFR